MKMTKRKEGELKAYLRKESISIPELQFGMKVSYREACSLIAYASGYKWISACESGNSFPVIASNLTRKDLSADICGLICKELGRDELKVLCYLGRRFNATFFDILEDVDDDDGDMQNALNNLIAARLVFKHERHYYCKISKKSIRLIQEQEKKQMAMKAPTDLQRLLYKPFK